MGVPVSLADAMPTKETDAVKVLVLNPVVPFQWGLKIYWHSHLLALKTGWMSHWLAFNAH